MGSTSIRCSRCGAWSSLVLSGNPKDGCVSVFSFSCRPSRGVPDAFSFPSHSSRRGQNSFSIACCWVKLILLLQSRRQSVTAPVLLRMLLVSLCIQEALEQRGLQRDRSTSYHRAKKTPKGDDSRGVPEAARKASMHAKGKREVQATEVLSESTWTASTHAESDPCMTC